MMFQRRVTHIFDILIIHVWLVFSTCSFNYFTHFYNFYYYFINFLRLVVFVMRTNQYISLKNPWQGTKKTNTATGSSTNATNVASILASTKLLCSTTSPNTSSLPSGFNAPNAPTKTK